MGIKKPSHKQFIEEQFENDLQQAAEILGISKLSRKEIQRIIAIQLGQEGRKSIREFVQFHNNLDKLSE